MRTLISPRLIALCLLSAVLSPLLRAEGPPNTPVQVTLSPKTWTTVPLPAMALGISEHAGVLWVAGADEMLARSDDQGRTWKVVHFQQDGELLFAVAFAGKDGWAMGSLGRELHSEDAGAHWQDMSNAPGSAIRLVAADAQHLMASSLQSFLFSANGGKTWVAAAEPASIQTPSSTPSVTGVAMPDANRAGALLDLPFKPATSIYDQQLFASTSDGGKSWQSIQFPAEVHITSLTTDASGYMAPGSQRVGDATNSVIFHSADGLHWSTTPNKPEVRWCHHAECLLFNDSNWVQWNHGAATYWQAPLFPILMNHWAAIPGVMCVVGDGLQCAQAQQLAAAPPEPAPHRLVKGVIPSRIRVGGWVQARNCLRCSPPKYPKQARARRISGVVLLHVVVGKDGHMQDVTLLAAPSRSLAESAMQAVRGWVYDPTTLDGHRVEVDTRVRVNFTLKW